MLPLVLNVYVLQVWLPAEGKALGNVADGHNHLFVKVHILYVFYICINQLFVKFYVLKL